MSAPASAPSPANAGEGWGGVFFASILQRAPPPGLPLLSQGEENHTVSVTLFKCGGTSGLCPRASDSAFTAP